MAAYKLHFPQQFRSGPSLLVLPPLIVTLVFCYGFILMQPHATKTITAASHGSNAAQDVQSKLSRTSFAEQSSLSIISSSPNADTFSVTPSTPSATSGNDTRLQAAISQHGTSRVINGDPGSNSAKTSTNTSKQTINNSVSNPPSLPSLLTSKLN